MISMNNMNPHQHNIDMVTLGERGQVVIPAAMREQLNLKSGDKLMVVCKDDGMIGLVPPAKFRTMVDHMTAQLSKFENQTD